MSSAGTVQGVKYETHVGGIGTSCSVEKCIFIPDPYRLNLSEDGSVSKEKSHLQTLAAYQAMTAVYRQINSKESRNEEGNLLQPQQETRLLVRQAMEDADKTALTPVQIPMDLVDQIKELYDKSVHDGTSKGEARTLNRDLKQIILDAKLFDD